MPVDLSQTLVIGITSTALFDLSEVDRKFRDAEAKDKDEAIEKYREEVISSENIPLNPGPGFLLIKKLLELNKLSKEIRLIEVIITSKNSPDAGLRILNSVRHYELDITRSMFRAGQPIAPFMKAFSIDLFLTTDRQDAQAVINSGDCAAAVISGAHRAENDIDEFIRIAFDGDAVLFSQESEVIYKTDGMSEFKKNEAEKEKIPMKDGPYANFLRKLALIRSRLPIKTEYSPLRISIVTARNAPADVRVINTLREWGIYVDEAYFLGGLNRCPVLAALKAHIFFDDQEDHIKSAQSFVASGHVPYPSDSPLQKISENQKQVNNEGETT